VIRSAAWPLVVVLLGATASHAAALQPIPALQARVTDLTGTLTATEQAALEQKLADFEARKGAQIAVLVVASTARRRSTSSIRGRGLEVSEKPDDGALLLVAKDDHGSRSGGSHLRALTDAMSNRIIDDTMVPLLRQAVRDGDRCRRGWMRVIDGENCAAGTACARPAAC
jgi:uncharacterized protein